MSAAREKRMPFRRSAMLVALLPLGACMGDNLGLESVNQPVVAGNTASVPSCPDWRSQGKDSAAATDSNYGCAVNGNLAAMIADPADLIHGRSEASDVEVSTRAIRAWRDVPPSGKNGLDKVSSTSGGNK